MRNNLKAFLLKVVRMMCTFSTGLQPKHLQGILHFPKGSAFGILRRRTLVFSHDAKFDEFLFEIQGVSSPLSSSSQDPFPPLELEPLLM